jgi:hypothetical protein
MFFGRTGNGRDRTGNGRDRTGKRRETAANCGRRRFSQDLFRRARTPSVPARARRFWRPHHEARKRNNLTSGDIAKAKGIPLKAFGNCQASPNLRSRRKPPAEAREGINPFKKDHDVQGKACFVGGQSATPKGPQGRAVKLQRPHRTCDVRRDATAKLSDARRRAVRP